MFSDSPRLDFQDCFQTVRGWIFGTVLDSLGLNLQMFLGSLGLNFVTVLGSLGTDFRIVISPCLLFLCVIAKKMNNMLVVVNSCKYMLG